MIRAVVDDLAFVQADAVVRPSTAALEPISPALSRLDEVAGSGYWKALDRPSRLGVGAAVVTAAGDLSADFVIHAVLMSEEEPVTPSGVRSAVVSILQRAADWELGTVAMPLLGLGPGNLLLEDAARIIVDILATDLPRVTYPRDVCIVVDSEEDRAVVDSFIRSLASQ
ncbi:MAG: macro domain-containing protein [Gemmatimonadales bacterium]